MIKLWKENPSNAHKSLWADKPMSNDDIEQSIDLIIQDTFMDKLRRLFHHRKKTDVKVTDYKNLTDEERLSILSDDFIDDDFDDYNCGCKCDLKECYNACYTYFVLQDAKPYRNVDMNVPELEYLSQEDKLTSYHHFKNMLKKRNSNPYYFFKYMFSKL